MRSRSCVRVSRPWSEAKREPEGTAAGHGEDRRRPPKPTVMEEALDAFLAHAAVECGLAKRTLSAYGRDLLRFVAHCAAFRPGHAGASSLRAFSTSIARSLESVGLAPRSRARMLVSVRRFARFLVATGRVDRDPSDELITPKLGRPLPKLLRAEETEERCCARRLARRARSDFAMSRCSRCCMARGCVSSELVSLPISRAGCAARDDPGAGQGRQGTHRPAR